jgi:exodeoxyribonuclease-1
LSAEFINLLARHPAAISIELARSEYVSMCTEYQSSVEQSVFVDFFTSVRRDCFLWHDYEAGGTDAKVVQPLQFAAIRTDMKHRVVDVPIDIYCQLPGDKLPHPVAIAITKINPMHCQSVGLPEPAFFRMIELEMSTHSLCVTGYNSMGYDEDVTRFGFWRNLLPVYDREYANYNSRWDLLSVTAGFCALGVDGIVWPKRDDGEGVSLKLEHLAGANNITQESAHNALDDVRALIGWSALLAERSPSLWNYFFDNRRKKNMSSMMAGGRAGLVFSAQFGHAKNFLAPILVIGDVPGESNKVVGVDLREIEALRSCWKMSVEDIRDLLFSKKETLEALAVKRPPIQTFMLNKAPAFVSQSWCESEGRNNWDPAWSDLVTKLSTENEFKSKLRSVFVSEKFDTEGMDAEVLLYSAGFPSDRDARNIKHLKGDTLERAFTDPLEWDNPMYAVLWQRARCKLNGTHNVVVSTSEMDEWSTHCRKQRSVITDNKKHDYVSELTVNSVLSETKMSESLREGYRVWLSTL